MKAISCCKQSFNGLGYSSRDFQNITRKHKVGCYFTLQLYFKNKDKQIEYLFVPSHYFMKIKNLKSDTNAINEPSRNWAWSISNFRMEGFQFAKFI